MPEERDDVEREALERVDPSSQRINVRSSLGYTVRQGGSRGVGGGLIYEESNRWMTIYSEAGMDRWFYEINGAQWLPADFAATEDATRRVATRFRLPSAFAIRIAHAARILHRRRRSRRSL
jgi:hypothetical protein